MQLLIAQGARILLDASALNITGGGSQELYATYCLSCHGNRARGGLKDLRFMTDETRAVFDDIVLKGAKEKLGMASFGDVLTPEQSDAIKNYVQARAAEDYVMFGE